MFLRYIYSINIKITTFDRLVNFLATNLFNYHSSRTMNMHLTNFIFKLNNLIS